MNVEQKNVNFGSGTHAPKHWLNFDASFRVWLDQLTFLRLVGYRPRFSPWVKRFNVVRPLPFAANSVDHVYSSHLIEHLTRAEAGVFLKECWRILKPGGRIRLMTPNLHLLVQDYLSRRNNPELAHTAADKFMQWLGVSYEGKPNKVAMMLNWGRDKNLHQWIYDEGSLKNLLEESGFAQATSNVNWISDFPDLDLLEPSELRVASTCAEGYK